MRLSSSGDMSVSLVMRFVRASRQPCSTDTRLRRRCTPRRVRSIRPHRLELRMHAVPIQTRAMIHTPVRTGGGKKSAATMAAFGIPHTDA